MFNIGRSSMLRRTQPLAVQRVPAVNSRPCSCRRRYLVTFALDGPWAKQAYVGSNSSSAAPAEEQQLQNTQPAAAASSSSAATPPQPTASSLQSSSSSSNGDSSHSSNGSSSDVTVGLTPVPSDPPTELPTKVHTLPWESWCEHFEQQDLAGTRLDSLQPQLTAAVAKEDYAAAAAIQCEINALTAADAVAAVQQLLAAAVESEQYAAAAVLRDQGFAVLDGWWACQDPDAAGHLLRVYPEYGRWTGKAYSPRELVEIQGWENGSSSRRGSSKVKHSVDHGSMSNLGTPVLEVFVKQQQQQQDTAAAAAAAAGGDLPGWINQAVILQPAVDNDSAAAPAAAAEDLGIEAEISDLFRSEVTKAVWGRGPLTDGTAAAAAAAAAGLVTPSSSPSRSNRLILGGKLAAFGEDDVMQSGDYSSMDESSISNRSSGDARSYELLFGDQEVDSELEPWEELLNAAESALAAAAAAADEAGGVLCADGQTRPLQRQTAAAAAAAADEEGKAPVTPVLQLLLEVVEGRSHVLLAARAVGGVTRSTSWTVSEMPPGPRMVPDWSLVTPDQIPGRQARLAASLEAQRIVREMVGAREGWWMTEFAGTVSPAAAAAEPEQQQQEEVGKAEAGTDWQLPLQMLLQQQQQQEPEDAAQQQQQQQQLDGQIDDTVAEVVVSISSTSEAGSLSGFYPEFYQDFGPGVTAGLADAGSSQQQQQQLQKHGISSSSSRSERYLNPSLADLAPAELDEVLETLEQLKSTAAAADGSSDAASNQKQQLQSSHIVWSPPATVDLHQQQEEEKQQQQEQQQLQQQQAPRGLRRKAPGFSNSISNTDRSSNSRWPSVATAWGSGLAAAGSGSSSSSGVGFGAVLGDELERHPASIVMNGKDKFKLKPQAQAGSSSSTSSSSDTSSQQQQHSISSSSSNSSKKPRRSIFVVEVPTRLVEAEGPPQQQQQQQPSVGGSSNSSSSSTDHSSKGYKRVWQLAAHQILLQYACSTLHNQPSSSSSSDDDESAAAAAAAARNFAESSLPITWRQPLARDLMAARAEEVLWGGLGTPIRTLEEEGSSSSDEAAAAPPAAAAAPNSSTSSSSMLCVPDDAPILVLQLPPELVEPDTAAAAAAAKEPATTTSCSSSSSSSKQGSASSAEPEGLIYRRLNTNYHPSDAMTGLFVGAFGQHGPEVLQVHRTMCMDSGEEQLVGLKLTGDVNVPAGEVAFRAKIGRKHKLSAKGMFAQQLNIAARYPGEGRVAGPRFTNPRWVPGELLVFNSSSSNGDDLASWIAGAHLGFVYDIPGQRRFCVLLNRISLP